MHGGPVCGVLAQAIEECESPVAMRVARMTVEMTRAVPLVPLSVRAEVTRAGRRVQQIDARIEAGGRVLARATALRLRIGADDGETAIPLPDPVPERRLESAPDPDARAFGPGLLAGFLRAVDFQRSRVPRHGQSGLAWARLRVPLVEGEVETPFVRLATLCDFASGAGNALDFRRSTSINPDLSLHVLREPLGEWIGLEARTGVEADGIGQSHAVLFDERGAVAHALASLLIERRPGFPNGGSPRCGSPREPLP